MYTVTIWPVLVLTVVCLCMCVFRESVQTLCVWSSRGTGLTCTPVVQELINPSAPSSTEAGELTYSTHTHTHTQHTVYTHMQTQTALTQPMLSLLWFTQDYLFRLVPGNVDSGKGKCSYDPNQENIAALISKKRLMKILFNWSFNTSLTNTTVAKVAVQHIINQSPKQ